MILIDFKMFKKIHKKKGFNLASELLDSDQPEITEETWKDEQ